MILVMALAKAADAGMTKAYICPHLYNELRKSDVVEYRNGTPVKSFCCGMEIIVDTQEIAVRFE